MKKKTFTYDIINAAVASNSATGYLASVTNFFQECSLQDITLVIQNMTEVSNLEMLKAFVEDLIHLKQCGVEIILSNKYDY